MDIAISVVVPVKNEADNIGPLVDEIQAAMRPAGEPFEIVCVDDGSTDRTADVLRTLKARVPELKGIAHVRNAGQSAGLRTGIRAARGALIVTLDGDGQNDPADIPAMIATYRTASAAAADRIIGLVAGQRVKRQDTFAKRLASRFANRVRRWALNDDTRDTGCGLKLIPRDVFLRLPYFDHMHRFLPALVQREGYAVAFQAVNHRPRRAGRSNYGVFDRAWVSIADLFGVMWLSRRCRPTGAPKEL